jgi:hypothetical protein
LIAISGAMTPEIAIKSWGWGRAWGGWGQVALRTASGHQTLRSS